MKVALVHDWLTGMRGGERCLEVFCEIFPDADLYTLIYLPEKVSPTIRAMKVRTSWLDRLPGVESYYRYCLPLFPSAIEKFKLEKYDLVLSSSHCVAKGIIPQQALHIAYIHSPMRYIWDLHDAYFEAGASRLARTGMSLCRRHLQRWDLRSSERVHCFIANSENIAAKIRKLYGREAAVIRPPVDTQRFFLRDHQQSYYLIVSALVPYKKIHVAIEAFNRLKLPLKIAGDGPLRKELAQRAGPTIEFLGWVDDGALPELYASCQALVFPGEEDFGIVPLEAQASGRPVIAYGNGGALETVVPWCSKDGRLASGIGPTGIFFREPTPESLIQAVGLFQQKQNEFRPSQIRDHACRFSRERFSAEITSYIDAQVRGSRAEK